MKRPRAPEEAMDADEIVTDEVRQRRYEQFMREWFAAETSIAPSTAASYAVVLCRFLADKPPKEAWPVSVEGLARQLRGDIDWFETLGDTVVAPADAEDIIRAFKRAGWLSLTAATKATAAAARERALTKIANEVAAKEAAKAAVAAAVERERVAAEAHAVVVGEVDKWQVRTTV